MIFNYKLIIACIVILIIIICEIFISIITFPFQQAEIPLVVSTGYNAAAFRVPFKPAWWATGGIIQTILVQALGRREKVIYRREYCTLSDNTNIALDIRDPIIVKDKTPILFVCHGLYGTADNGLVRELSHILTDYRIIVYTRRGHGGTKLHCKFPTHTDIEDMDEVVKHIHSQYPDTDIIGFGYSAGANLIVKYAGAVPGHPFKKVLSISNGYHINEITNNCSWVVSQLLMYYMYLFMDKHVNDLKDLCARKKIRINWDKILCCNSIQDIDAETAAKLNGYSCVEDYYEDCSSYNWLEKVNVPILCMSSLDDPVITRTMNYHSIKIAFQNKNIIAVITKKGGHVGWIDRYAHSWGIDRMVDFIRMDLQKLS